MMTKPETAATDVAGRQGGYRTRRQALACGMTENVIRQLVRSRRWRRVKPGLYQLAGFLPSLRGTLLAATAVWAPLFPTSPRPNFTTFRVSPAA